MDYRIAIPTISRSKTIREKTIGYLLRTDIDLSKIDIFFSKPEEIEDYKKELKDLPIKNYIPTNQKHIRLQRNFISRYYPKNTFVVGIDDDIQSLQTKINDKKTVELTQLNDFILNAFKISQMNKSDMSGIGAVLNPFFMKNAVSFNLKYIVGCFYGWKNTNQPKNTLSTEKGKDGYFITHLGAYIFSNTSVVLSETDVQHVMLEPDTVTAATPVGQAQESAVEELNTLM